MTDFIRIFIPLFFILFFMTAFVGMSCIVAKRIGKNPDHLPKDDSAYGLIGRYFKLTLITLFLYTIFLFLFPYEILLSFKINFLDAEILKLTGAFLMVLSFIWVIVAQYNMKNSWRIGIDKDLKTDLITEGLFRYSRNPIFLGMIVSLAGLCLLLPTLISLIFLIISVILIQIQIRHEEEFLLQQHGTAYLNYKIKVRRLI
ncbi:isoprenylcysteine carboxylmethyltransferase family protein [Chryseobacterium sp. JUb7]|uniref:methyltransferase family protein n=1 Tax=Chryseobacterium sp. JUb7 TaxID=2940599 RepID=UPI0021681AEB|nr:isoprenylcysteine carboxylmethyltransferase family protein [Chryseobacterium sp. JUb7]MCS3529084.1 protein-S-isoprenylcysteine O-methyltransferase Ste14 [Chryseobacterium sp. JUb7]